MNNLRGYQHCCMGLSCSNVPDFIITRSFTWVSVPAFFAWLWHLQNSASIPKPSYNSWQPVQYFHSVHGHRRAKIWSVRGLPLSYKIFYRQLVAKCRMETLPIIIPLSGFYNFPKRIQVLLFPKHRLACYLQKIRCAFIFC